MTVVETHSSLTEGMNSLPAHAVRFQRQSGVITWDRGALSSCKLDEDISRILHAAALLEEDTAISSRQARSLGIDRSPDMAAFLTPWEQEEAEHARALRFLLAQQAYHPLRTTPTVVPFRRRCVARLPATALHRLPQTDLIFCALGAASEYVVVVTYTELAKRVQHPAAVSLLRAIARQEGRHFAFFLAAARHRAEALSTINGFLARKAFTSIWEPVGVPSLGLPTWRAVFAPLLANGDFCARVEVMDRVIDTIPHLGGLHLMENFLRDCTPRSPGRRIP
jgi:rubrerythrin